MSAPAEPAQERILAALERAAARIEELERGRNEPVAVIGLGCRFPGAARDAASFWRNLRAGRDCVGEAPQGRWAPVGEPAAAFGGFLEEVDRFDAEFFGVSPREAAAMDPQQRLLLEVAHEALDSAGQPLDRLADNTTGVFVGLTNSDYGHLLKVAAAERPLDQYFVMGNSPNAAAGRVSYLLGLRGPSLVVDTACSSSLVAVHLACQSLRSGECRLALAGGVNLILSPEPSVALARARMLAPDGRCKTFAAAADGYGRGEGCGVVVLKRLADARADGDRVLAVIRSSAVNQDGPTSGFTVPSGEAQRALLRAALDQARLEPADIDFVEAHGTGTPLGDPIEVHALAAVLGANRPADRPLLIGSVKANIGHLESAAGASGLIKTILAIWHGEVPAQLNFAEPNPRIAWNELPVRVAAAHGPWPMGRGARRAGVSSFGVSGTNAHVIVEQAPPELAAGELPAPSRRFRGARHWFKAAAEAPGLHYGVSWIAGRSGREVNEPLADPGRHRARVEAWLAQSGEHPGGPGYAAISGSLDGLARRFAREAREALAAADVAPAREPLWRRVQALAAEAPAGSAAAEAARLRARCPEAAIELDLLVRCGERLAEVLRGHCDPLTLLFPGKGAASAADLYGGSPVARRVNGLLGAAVAALVEEGAPAPRVLEVGAGTGAATRAVLAALPPGASYIFTDVSPHFVAEAGRTWADRPGMRFRTLDLERDPRGQGWESGSFDLIVAANVLHATRDVRAALRNARSLLAPGGRLMLLEATEAVAWLDLIFGLTDGWWRFGDPELRPAHPLMGPAGWRRALKESGFAAPDFHRFAPEAGDIFAAQSVIVAGCEPEPASWLLLLDRGGIGAALADELERSGARCVRWSQDPGDDPEPLRRVLRGQADWAGVVDLRGIDAGADDSEATARRALELAQALADHPARLWWVTRGAVAPDSGDALPGLGAAVLWGFARVLAHEHPELQPVRIDLDPGEPAGESARTLAAELRRPDGEDQIAWRRGIRRLARLEPAAAPGKADLPLRADATYLIVGGLGGLGKLVAAWLVEGGARHLVLAGRSAPGPETADLVRDLAAAGADVRLERADVADAGDVARLLAGIASGPWPLRGVIHSGGVLDDGVLARLTWERFARVLAPKVAGAWHLHRLTQGLPLDFFVLFSSAAAVLGPPGQANHAAANEFLDALARQRRAEGLPALSIGWGAWAEVGAAANPRLAERFRARGIGALRAAEARDAFERLLASPAAHGVVLAADWSTVPAGLVRSPFFDAVRAPAKAASAAERPASTVDWSAFEPKERAARVLAEVRSQVAQVLGLPGGEQVDPGRGFFNQGMDSLTSLELRNRLQAAVGRALPATFVFDYPTPEALAHFLASSSPAPVEPAAAPARPALAAGAAGDPSQGIAVVGLGMRLPGGVDSPESLWALLAGGVDAVGEIPADRWDAAACFDPDPAAAGKIVTRAGGFLKEVDRFDAGFFGISPREAAAMDPQQRLLLEVAWEALERGGIAPDSLAGSRTGVFVGISNHDYAERLLAGGPASIGAFMGSGNAHSVAAGRLSFTLGLQGPSLAVDTACSSSLVATHLACQSLLAGESVLALAGGVNLLLSPTISINHSRARMLAPDGRCKSFDAAADGFGRSEGCGILVLKRLADARRDGNRIFAVLAGSAVNQDGRTSGLTVPNGRAQQEVIRAALEPAGLQPDEVDLIEAHGTGTALGDPIELNALAAVFGAGRAAPLFVGSIKTQVGHAESAAGVAGLMKAILAVGHGLIPPHLHFRNPNPRVGWDAMPWLRIPREMTPWPAGRRRLAGVSSFGFGGTNAHVIVAEPPAAAVAAPARGGEALVLSARTEAALALLAGRHSRLLAGSAPAWADLCRTAATGRAMLPHRLAVGWAAPAEVGKMLAAFAAGEPPAGVWAGRVADRPKIAFLFPGQGAVYPAMGRQLYAEEGPFRAAIDACAEIVRTEAGWDLAHAIGSAEQLARTEFGQVALFAVEYALARLWNAWGVQPDAVVGHSAGEFAAACIAGRLALPQALRLVIERARMMGELGDSGAMAAVTGAEADVAGLLGRHGLELGAVNSPGQIVLSGDRGAVHAAVAELKAAGRRAELIDVAQAYHSRHMEAMLPAFRARAAAILGRDGSVSSAAGAVFVSSVDGAVAAGSFEPVEYWVRQIRQPVRFGRAMSTLRDLGVGLLIEVGPRAVLTGLGRQNWPSDAGEWLASLLPVRGEWAQLQEAAARAWVAGAPVDWKAVYRDRLAAPADLPTYPFERRRHWCDEAQPAEELAYEIVWQPAGPGRERTPLPTGPWSLAGGRPEVRASLARELARRGRAVVEDGDARAVAALFLTEETDPAAAGAVCEQLRGFAARPGPDRRWILTRGAVAVPQSVRGPANPAGAAVWGFGRALALERPETFGGLIDLDPEPSAREAERIVEAMLAPRGEEQLALRGAGAWVPRLNPVGGNSGHVRIDPEGTYLVTGGAGALGLRVAGWLAARGARRLVLVSRRPAGPGASAAMAAWRGAGVTVETPCLDVADAPAVRALVAGLPELRGIVHAAGIPGYVPLERLSAGDLADVLRPKAAGAWALHEATAGRPLDFFILFSSIAAVWGSRGQAHYAAANAFLDGLAQHRKALGMPALSVNWGPWAGDGMAGGEARTLLERIGLQGLAADGAIQALEAAQAAGAVQRIIARVNWPKFKAALETRGPRPFFERLAGEAAKPAVPRPAAAAEWGALAPEERAARVREHVQRTVGQVLRMPEDELPSPRTGFIELGVDSLLAVEIRNRLAAELALPLPATLVFDHPEIERLSAHLAGLLTPMDAPHGIADARAAEERVARMSEDEAEAALLAKLREL